ncbi:choice-of-anchor P family protein [Nocardioides sp. J54]|uniref:choice-of-anchor P family protein n=1 Tax=Nocardioides sp. J54 TaxID=935866 RepID=UPI00048F32FD|nr:choice-of-anchor P family protein [Nocardioides sp. J54]
MTRTAPRPSRQPRRRARLLVTGGILVSTLPLTSGTLSGTPAQAADEREVSYGGYTATAWSSPVRVEVFEPALPIPTDAGIAQLELLMGYSKVKADSGEWSGRSSLFWPGDPVGEGLKTFAEQLGLPETPLTANGYQFQVNSRYPSDTPTAKDATIPGAIQQTTSGEHTAIAETGFSPDGAVLGPDTEEDGKAGAANPLSGLTEGLQGLLGGLTGQKKAAAAPLNPLGALVDVDGYVSVSKMDATKGPVTAVSRSLLGEVRLLGGLVTLGGVETVARATTDGAKGKATGKAVWGKMSIAGQEFGIGPDGAIVSGKTMPIPGLQDLPAKALEQLGITFEVPKPGRTVDGDAAQSAYDGLRITIDLKLLAPLLKALPFNVLAELIPAEAGPVKGVVSGLSTLSPRIVVTIGAARASVDTVPAIEAAPIPPVTGGGQAPPASGEAPSGGAPAAGSVGVPPAAGAPAPTGATPAAPSDAPVTDLVDAAPASAGLPELFSIPGMLLLVAFAVAAVAGSWFRRLGAAALGAGAPCAHGLETGLPDLRKA